MSATLLAEERRPARWWGVGPTTATTVAHLIDFAWWLLHKGKIAA